MSKWNTEVNVKNRHCINIQNNGLQIFKNPAEKENKEKTKNKSTSDSLRVSQAVD